MDVSVPRLEAPEGDAGQGQDRIPGHGALVPHAEVDQGHGGRFDAEFDGFVPDRVEAVIFDGARALFLLIVRMTAHLNLKKITMIKKKITKKKGYFNH